MESTLQCKACRARVGLSAPSPPAHGDSWLSFTEPVIAVRTLPPHATAAASRMKVGFITLGCDKNTVDSERYLAQLADRGAEYTDDLAEAR